MLFIRLLRRSQTLIQPASIRQLLSTQTRSVAMSLAPRDESPLSDVPDVILPKRTRKKAAKEADSEVVSAEGIVENKSEDTNLRKSGRKCKVVNSNLIAQETNAEDEVKAIAKKPKRSKKKGAIDAADAMDAAEGELSPKKKRRRKTPEEEKVYDIPPIENVLGTTFKGRLGYACLNTILRKYDPPIFCSRTCRLSTLAELGPQHLRTLGLQNIKDLLKLIHWNAQHGIRFMRMSSEMFPFASHPEHGYTLEFADEELKAVGKAAKEHEMRLTSHPGQFTQLGSPRDVVVANAIRDLTYHCEMMDRMGLDQDSIMIIHMGGTFKDKEATIERFKQNYAKLSDSVKARLVLENDEICYNVDDLLPICRELSIPIVFDYHHDWIYPSSRPPAELIPEINTLWHTKGIKPKQHLSEPRPGAESVMEKRAHSDRVQKLPEDLPDDMDLMLECKDKEQAVFYMYRLYNLQEVDPKVLRPAADVETLQTKGRKSNKRAKVNGESEGESDLDNLSGPALVADGGPSPTNVTPKPRRKQNKVNKAIKSVIFEAEEHAAPLTEAVQAIDSAIEDGGLHCGSGDESLEIEKKPKEGGRRSKRKMSLVVEGASKKTKKTKKPKPQ